MKTNYGVYEIVNSTSALIHVKNLYSLKFLKFFKRKEDAIDFLANQKDIDNTRPFTIIEVYYYE